MVSAEKLDKMKERKIALEAKIQKCEAAEKVRKRKQDTRRKILIGAYYLDQAMASNSMEDLNKIMQGYLTRDIDKKLFVTITPAKSIENPKENEKKLESKDDK
jgi:large subunit ribosomal protein L7/L12